MESASCVADKYGYDVAYMSDFVPELQSKEECAFHFICSDECLYKRAQKQARGDRALGKEFARFGDEQKLKRTARLGAQYLALGRFATERRYLVCSHNTPHVAWYKPAQTPVLQNSVTVH